MTVSPPNEKIEKNQYGYLSESSLRAEYVFDNENSLRIVTYPTKENY